MTALTINGKTLNLDLKGHELLIDVLRDELGLTGTKDACGEGQCGSCTVLLNGKAVLSCQMLAVEAEGAEITTIEGLADGDNLHPLQQSFLDKGGVQCGFCTPGMVLASKALLDKNPDPTREEIKTALDGNICRCAGYLKIFEAVEDAAAKLRGQKTQT